MSSALLRTVGASSPSGDGPRPRRGASPSASSPRSPASCWLRPRRGPTARCPRPSASTCRQERPGRHRRTIVRVHVGRRPRHPAWPSAAGAGRRRRDRARRRAARRRRGRRCRPGRRRTRLLSIAWRPRPAAPSSSGGARRHGWARRNADAQARPGGGEPRGAITIGVALVTRGDRARARARQGHDVWGRCATGPPPRRSSRLGRLVADRPLRQRTCAAVPRCPETSSIARTTARIGKEGRRRRDPARSPEVSASSGRHGRRRSPAGLATAARSSLDCAKKHDGSGADHPDLAAGRA